MPSREAVVASAPGAYSNRYKALESERRKREKQTTSGGTATPGRDRTKELRLESKKRREAFKRKEEQRLLKEDGDRSKLLQERREKMQASSKGFKRAVQVRQKKLAMQKQRQQEKELLAWARATTPPDLASVMAEVAGHPGRASDRADARSRHGSSSSYGGRPGSRSGRPHTPAMMDKVLEHERMLSNALSVVRGAGASEGGGSGGGWGLNNVDEDGGGGSGAGAHQPPSAAQPFSPSQRASRLPGPASNAATPSAANRSEANAHQQHQQHRQHQHQRQHSQNHPDDLYDESYRDEADNGYRDRDEHQHPHQHPHQHQHHQHRGFSQQHPQHDSRQPRPPPQQQPAQHRMLAGRAGTSRPTWMRNSAQRQHPHPHQHQNAPSDQHDDDSSASGSHSSHSHSDGGIDDDDDDDDDGASIDSLDKSLAVPAATHNHSSHSTANIDRPFPFPFPFPDPDPELPQYDRPASNAYTRAQNHERRMSIGDLSGSDALEDSASDGSEASADSMDGDGDGHGHGDGDSDDDLGSPPQSPYEHHHHHHHHHQKPLPHKPDRALVHPPSASASRRRPPVQPAAAHVRKRTIGGGSAVHAPKPGGAEGTEGGGVSRLRQPSAVSMRPTARQPPRTRAHRNDAPRHGYAGGVAGAANIEEVMEDVMGGSGSGGPRASQSRSVGWTLDVPEVWGARTPTSAGTHYQPKLAKTPTDDEINKLWAALRNGISSNRDVQEEEEEEQQLPHADALQAQPRPASSITDEPSSRSASAVQHQPPGTASSSGGGSEPGSRLGTAAGRFNLQNTLARARAMTGSSRGTRKQTKAERIRAEAEADEAKLLASLEKLNTRLHVTYTDGKPPTDGAAAGAESNDAAAAPTKSPSKSKTGAGSRKGKQKAEKVIDGKVWDGKGRKALSAKEEQIIAARKAYSTKKPKKKPKEKDAVDAWMLRSVNDTLSAMAAMEAANR